MTNKLLRTVLAIALLASVSLAGTPQVSAQALYHDANPYIEHVIQHESSGRPWVVNYLGCMGLMQACPQTQVWYGNTRLSLPQACPNWPGDVACQLDFFERYKNERYHGSWYEAYIKSITDGWW